MRTSNNLQQQFNDYSMGTLDTPAPITSFEDLRDYGLC